ncbi:hypothetical protein ACWEJP_21960 [Streptomyces sp. NPDC004749]
MPHHSCVRRCVREHPPRRRARAVCPLPAARGRHDGTDPRRERFFGDQFAGIDYFPFASTEISLMAVHPRILDLAEALLGEESIQIYGAEARAKLAGASDYDQIIHTDYRPAAVTWGRRRGWAYAAVDKEWYRFVSRAIPRQLQVFGFPPPGHPYWTPQTLAGMSLRYPDLDLSAWADAAGQK